MPSKKDSYWFRHDATAGRALKMRKMAFKFDHWGKGVYWDVIEILRDQSGYRYESNEESLTLLADLIGCKDAEKFTKWFNECLSVELFKEKDGFFYSEILSKNMVKWETKKKNGSAKKKRKGSEKEAKGEDKIRLDKITEDNRTEYDIIFSGKKPKTSFIDIYFNDLPNSQYLEDVCRINEIKKESLLAYLPEFKKRARVEYKNFNEFVDHFKYAYLKKELENSQKQAPIVVDSSFKPPRKP